MNHSSEIKIEIPSRIHATLLAMDSPFYRINGGIGFAIDLWNYHIAAKISDSIIIMDDRPEEKLSNLDVALLTKALETAKQKYSIDNGICIRITQGPPRHIGLGSGTALLLGSLEAYMLLSGMTLNQEELTAMSGRGGTSGIGIHTYFYGGFVLDGGQRYNGQTHAPSRSNETRKEKALLISRVDMPNWRFGIFVPEDTIHLSGNEESSFFNNTCPITQCEAALATYHSVFGAFCSAKENDLENFRRSINEIQGTKWKSEELKYRGNEFLNMFEKLKSITQMVGLSSLGPLMYFMSDNIESALRSIRNELGAGRYAMATTNNIGRKIEIV
jgi:beta-ribofuranosylaminobenzene 5'-phosphate synthase